MKNKKQEEKTTKQIIKDKMNHFQKNTFKSTEVIFLVVLTAVVGVMAGYFLNHQGVNYQESDSALQEIIDNYNYIIDNYYDDVDKDEMVSGAINGMLEALGDDYSSLLSQDSSSTFYMNLEGSYEGIGVEIYNNDENNIVVLDVLDDSPSEKAGIKSGDIIKQIDDTSMLDTNISELTKYVKENDKKEYQIIIIRDNQELTMNIERSTVTIKSVASKLIEKENHKIGYIYISIFSNSTTSQFEQALKELEEDGIDSLIIDVRENTGGHLTTATQILSLLMDSKHVIYQIEKNGEKTKYYSYGDETKTYPIVVLQNSNSASASELLSAALKESYGATIVGETSYGKGTVQEVVDLNNGDTYKFTTKKWLTPNGNWIHKTGVSVDVEVSLSDEYQQNPSDDTDNQLQAAIDVIINKK